MEKKTGSRIGTLQEKSLHAALKAWYALPSDQIEVKVDGFVVDIVRGPLLVEIQTRNFSALKSKLVKLVEQHPLRLVHPIAREKWIRRVAADGETILGRRKSSRRGCFEQIFDELVTFPQLIAHPNFSLEVLLIQEEEIRRAESASTGRRRRWRHRGWRIHDRHLLAILDRRLLESPADFALFLPPTLPRSFTNLDLAEAAGQPRYLAQKMTYCLRRMGALRAVGKRGRAILYERAPAD